MELKDLKNVIDIDIDGSLATFWKYGKFLYQIFKKIYR